MNTSAPSPSWFHICIILKYLFRKVANVPNSSIDLILRRPDAHHYPNFEFSFFLNFESLKTLPLQFCTNSFCSEWARCVRFYHKKYAILIKFVKKLSLRAVYRWWFDFHFFYRKPILSFCHTKTCDFITKLLVLGHTLATRKEPSSPANANTNLLWMLSMYISIPKISISRFRAHKITIFQGWITILIFLFSVFS